ncbi:MAG: DUF5615 family PIN-like protein [Planctomycetota bacterium]
MIVLTDHCLPGKTIKLLRSQGYRIITLKELNKTSVSDREVLQITREQDAILITCDLDFANILVYPPEHYQGIIVLRMNSRTEDKINLLLMKYLVSTEPDSLRKKLIIIDSGGVRIRF